MYGMQNKWCFVPYCTSTSVSTPDKLFVSVPEKYSRKSNWFKAARRGMPKSKSMFFCCEDHFNLHEDMENYIRYKLVGGKIILKTEVVPHIFDCQSNSNRKRTSSANYRSRWKRKQLIDEAISAFRVKNESNLPSTFHGINELVPPQSAALNETKMNIKHEEQFEIKQEEFEIKQKELIIKDEFISDP